MTRLLDRQFLSYQHAHREPNILVKGLVVRSMRCRSINGEQYRVGIRSQTRLPSSTSHQDLALDPGSISVPSAPHRDADEVRLRLFPDAHCWLWKARLSCDPSTVVPAAMRQSRNTATSPYRLAKFYLQLPVPHMHVIGYPCSLSALPVPLSALA